MRGEYVKPFPENKLDAIYPDDKSSSAKLCPTLPSGRSKASSPYSLVPNAAKRAFLIISFVFGWI